MGLDVRFPLKDFNVVPPEGYEVTQFEGVVTGFVVTLHKKRKSLLVPEGVVESEIKQFYDAYGTLVAIVTNNKV